MSVRARSSSEHTMPHQLGMAIVAFPRQPPPLARNHRRSRLHSYASCSRGHTRMQLLQVLESLHDFEWSDTRNREDLELPLCKVELDLASVVLLFTDDDTVDFFWGPERRGCVELNVGLFCWEGTEDATQRVAVSPWRMCQVVEELMQAGYELMTGTRPDIICIKTKQSDLRPLWTTMREMRLDQELTLRYSPGDCVGVRMRLSKERRALARAWRILRCLSQTARFKRELMMTACRPSRLCQI